MKKILPILFLAAILSGGKAAAEAPNLFTYQGRLKENNIPVTGNRNIKIQICDALTGGVCEPGAEQPFAVANGLFKSTFTINSVDFSSGEVYIEVIVAGNTLSPRERLASAPYAIHVTTAVYASNLFARSGSAGVISSTSIFITDGDLSVAGEISVGNIKITAGASAGHILQSDASGNAAWVSPSAGAGDQLGNHIATTTLNMAGFQIINVSTIITNTDFVVLGPFSYGNGAYSISIGSGNYNSYNGGVGIGYTAHSNYSYGVGMGNAASGNYNSGVGIGRSAYNNFDSGVGVGYFAHDNYGKGVGIGYNASNNTDNAVGIGAYSQNNASYGTGIGVYTTAASSSVALGSNAKANAERSLAFGAGTVNNSTGTASFGIYAIETSDNIIAGGGIKASSGTFTIFGANQYSIETSSGILVNNGVVNAPYFIGNGAGLTGITASGVDTGSIVDADISATAAIAYSKLATLSDGNILVGNASNKASGVAMTGDVTIDNTGATSIGATKVTNAMLAGSIADSKLNQITAANKVAAEAIADGVLSSYVKVSSVAVDAVYGHAIRDDAVTNLKIFDGAVTGGKISGNSVSSSHIVDGSVNDDDVTLSTGSIISGKFADDRVSITTNGVTGKWEASNIADGNLGLFVKASSVTLIGFYSDNAVRGNLGLAIGTNVQAWDTDLDKLATNDGSSLVNVPGDSLGNHIATKTLDMATFDINVSTLNANGANGLFLLDDAGNGIFIEDGGNVGIGTISPLHPLHVNGNVGVQGTIMDPAGSVLELGSASNHLDFSGGKMWLDSASGNLGIGITSPSSKFDVFNGSITIRGTGAGIAFETGARSLLPETDIALGGGIRVSTNVYIVGFSSAAKYFGDGSALTGVTDSGAVQKSGDDMTGSLTLLSGSTLTVSGNAFSVGSSTLVVTNGKVGIGDLSPSFKLTVRDTLGGAIAGLMNSGNSPAGAVYGWVNSGSASAIKGVTNGTGYAGRFEGPVYATENIIAGGTMTVFGNAFSVGGSTFVVKNGAVGIGEMNPNSPLYISAKDGNHLALMDASGSNNIGINTVPGNNKNLLINVNNPNSGIEFDLLYDPKLVISSNGNVGVGLAVPLARLHVSSGAGEVGNILVVSTGASNIFSVSGDGRVTAVKYLGDGSALSNLPPNDNLGNHVATTTLNMSGNYIVNISSVIIDGNWADEYVLKAGSDGINISTGGAITTTGMGHGTTAGGIRGFAAVDLQTSRNFVQQVASGDYSTIGGGYSNSASSQSATVSGGQDNIANGNYAAISGGMSNEAGEYGFVGSGYQNAARGVHSVVAGGWWNDAFGESSVVGGGSVNTADGEYSTLSGGKENEIYPVAYGATIGGGSTNTVSGIHATIAGGQLNNALADQVFIGGGSFHTIDAEFATISGGNDNKISAAGYISTIGGGAWHNINNSYATISGGSTNTASGLNSTIAGGDLNEVIGNYSTIGGGEGSKASGLNSVISGGSGNLAFGESSVVGGGKSNKSTGTYSVVAGGFSNVTDGMFASIGGGTENRASEGYGVISGGYQNMSAGFGAAVPGGFNNYAGGNYSFAAGNKSSSSAMGSFTWADSEGIAVDNNAQDRTWFKNRGGFLVTASTESTDGGLNVMFNGSSATVKINGDLALGDGFSEMKNKPITIWLRNNSGAIVTYGDIVIIDSAAQNSFKTTLAVNDPAVIGVVYGDSPTFSIGPGSIGKIAIHGVVKIKSFGAVTAGQHVFTSGTTAGRAGSAAIASNGTGIGKWLENGGVAGLYNAVLLGN